MRKSALLVATFTTMSLLLGGCASSLTGDSYSRDEARRVQTVRMGTIESLRPVKIEGTKTPIGGGAGAIVGGQQGRQPHCAGPFHHGLFDIGYMRHIPNWIFMQAKDEDEFVDMLWTMANYDGGPSAIRYPRGAGTGVKPKAQPQLLEIGKALA